MIEDKLLKLRENGAKRSILTDLFNDLKLSDNFEYNSAILEVRNKILTMMIELVKQAGNSLE